MRLVAVSSLIAAASAGEPPHGTPGPRRRLQEKGLRVCIQKMIYDGYQGGNAGEPRGFNPDQNKQWKSYEANRWANDDGFSEPPQPDEHLIQYAQCQVRDIEAGKCSEDTTPDRDCKDGKPGNPDPDVARVVAFLNVTFSGTPIFMEDNLVDKKVLVKQFQFGLTDASGQPAIFPEMVQTPGSSDPINAQLKKCGFLKLGEFGYIRPSGGQSSEYSSPTVDNGAELYELIPGTQTTKGKMVASTKFDEAARNCNNRQQCEASSPPEGENFVLDSLCNYNAQGGCFGFALPVSFYIPLNASFPKALQMPQRPYVVFFGENGNAINQAFTFDETHFDYVTDPAGECFEDPNGGAQQDPHLHFAHGGRADFRGQHGAYYNFFSAPGLAVNVKTEERTGGLPGDGPSRLVTRVAVNRTPPSCCTTASSRWTAPSSPRRTSSRAWVARSASGPTSPSGPRSSTARTGAGAL